jgi:predicted nucleotidyltransferase
MQARSYQGIGCVTIQSMSSQKLQRILQQIKEAFSGIYADRLVTIVLFGSQARGDAEQGSDIDLMVVLKGAVNSALEVNRTIDLLSDLSLENDEVISCVFMDEERYRTEKSPLLLNVRREGRSL